MDGLGAIYINYWTLMNLLDHRYVDPFIQLMDLRNGFEMALDVCPSMELISYFESQGT